MRKKHSVKETYIFWGIMFLLTVCLVSNFYGGSVNAINSTMFAFSYKYGFVSRGLLGTVFRAVNYLLPWEMFSYSGVLRFSQVMTVCYMLLLFLFFAVCLAKANDSRKKHLEYMIFFFTIFAIPIFVGEENFGRLDIYMIMVSLIAMICLICRKCEWMVIPLAAIGVMVHQGYVFMFVNVILVFLFYRMMSEEEKRGRRKYLLYFVATFLVVSVLFLWFELFSHVQGEDIYEEIISAARNLCADGVTIHQDVIDKEILGINISGNEWLYHIMNGVEFPVYAVLMLPYLVIGFRFFRGLIVSGETTKEKMKYLAVAVGSLTILPDMLLKIDFGRWVFSVIFYYAVIVMTLLAVRDTKVERQIGITMKAIKKKGPISLLLLIYPFLFQPMLAIYISDFTWQITKFLNANFLHLWQP